MNNATPTAAVNALAHPAGFNEAPAPSKSGGVEGPGATGVLSDAEGTSGPPGEPSSSSSSSPPPPPPPPPLEPDSVAVGEVDLVGEPGPSSSSVSVGYGGESDSVSDSVGAGESDPVCVREGESVKVGDTWELERVLSDTDSVVVEVDAVVESAVPIVEAAVEGSAGAVEANVDVGVGSV